MLSRAAWPCALTVAGSDSGGGAGIQADLKTFAALRVHGTTAVTCLTAQNPAGVLGVHPVPPGLVRLQVRAVFEGFRPAAVKTGMLFSRGIIEAVSEALAEGPACAWVVDPVMVATSGARLLKSDAIAALEQKLLPRVQLVTPNRDEAEVLTGLEIRDIAGLRSAARKLRERFGCAALVKGGHLEGARAVDVFWDGREELVLSAKRILGVSSHGTGCTYSAAITAHLAWGHALPEAVRRAKRYIARAIARSVVVDGHSVLAHG